MEDRVIEFPVSSATVELASRAIGCAQAQIAKTLSFYLDDSPILIVMAGTAKADNVKFKATFHKKAKMIPFEEVEAATGHAAGGVCPFCVKEGVKIFLDVSLKTGNKDSGDFVYPAAGSCNSAVRLTVAELEKYAPHEGWTDVCRLPE
ncbi:MAG: YbaK/EbsC family protein [Candidatus Borkfalkiaceae bacterium]|nr:YbaK/EbsC family protein [Clostridia bacterium]MDY6222530.1 YbaK/EbsC family protein [Christensenellaceae bacterium]